MDYSLLKVAGLKEQLRKDKLPVSGTKAELLARLNAFHGKPSSGEAGKESKKKKVTNQQNVNIYVGETGQVQKADEGKNIYISSGVRASPFLPSGNNPTMQSTSSVKHPVVTPATVVKYSGVPKPSSSSSTSSSSSSSAPSSSGTAPTGMIGEDDEPIIEKTLPKKLVLSQKFTDKLNKALSGSIVPTVQQALVQSMPQTTLAMPVPSPPPPPQSKKNDQN
jgi:hypothetical protein